MTLDDSTRIEEAHKQEALSFILHNIDQMYEYGVESDIISDEVSDVTLEDIDRYMNKISVDQDSPIKLLTVNATNIIDPVYTNDIVNDFQAYPLTPISFQRVYFIEGGSFALVMLPIVMANGKIQIILQPLESSLSYIQDEYNKVTGKRSSAGRMSIEDLKKKISFVKFPKQK